LLIEVEELIDTTISNLDFATTIDKQDLKESIQKKYLTWLQYYGTYYDLLKTDIASVIQKDEKVGNLLTEINTLYNNYNLSYSELYTKIDNLYAQEVM
jgi:hypothetical protein